MNKLILVGRVVNFDLSNRTLKLRVPSKRKTDEFTIHFPNAEQNLIRFLQDKFAFNELVRVNASITISKVTKRIEIHANDINFYK